MADRPNVLFIHTDEQRADTLGCYGNDLVETPHIDRLAREGATFEEAHCTHPLCMPSRGSLLTGRYPSAHGTWRNGIPIREDERTIADLLGDAGYTTGLIGKAHFTPYKGDPDEHPESVQIDAVGEDACWEFWREFDGPYYGFEHVETVLLHGHNEALGGHYGRWLAEEHPESRGLIEQEAAIGETDPEYNVWTSALPPELHSSNWVADRTIEFMDAAAAPFYAWVGIPDPHFPYNPPEEYARRYDPSAVERHVDPEGEVWGEDPPRYVTYHIEEKYGTDWRDVPESVQREMLANYLAMVDLLDDAVGRILDALEERGLAEDTVVVFTADHGDWMGEHGLFQKGLPHTRGLTRIPQIVRWPGVADPGRRVEGVASQVDLVPTLLDACGVEIPYGVQGESLRPVLTGEQERLREFALVEHRHEAYRPESFFVRNTGAADVEEMGAMQDNLVNWTDEDIHVRTVYTDRYRYSHVTGIEGEHGELFDLEADPEETENLWGKRPAVRSKLRDTLIEAMLHAEDPLPERRYPV
ncbi:MAG: sulfatase [Halobacteriales archaeon]